MLTMRWYASAALSYWPNSISESPRVPQFQGSSGELAINSREYSATLVKLWPTLASHDQGALPARGTTPGTPGHKPFHDHGRFLGPCVLGFKGSSGIFRDHGSAIQPGRAAS